MPSNAFEVERILSDKISNGKSRETLYLVQWKITKTKDMRPYLSQYREEIRNVWAVGSELSIVWHDSWLPASALQDSCDEILGAYLLLKLYNHPTV